MNVCLRRVHASSYNTNRIGGVMVRVLVSSAVDRGFEPLSGHTIFFHCDQYTDNREIIFNSLNWLPSNININVNLLTKGSDLLTYQENITTVFLNMLLNILKTPKDLQLSK